MTSASRNRPLRPANGGYRQKTKAAAGGFLMRFLLGSGKTALLMGANPIRFVLGRTLGLVSLVIGVVALLLSFAGILGFLGGVLGIIGLLVGFFGMRMMRRGRLFNIQGLLGIVLNLAAIFMGFHLLDRYFNRQPAPVERPAPAPENDNWRSS